MLISSELPFHLKLIHTVLHHVLFDFEIINR